MNEQFTRQAQDMFAAAKEARIPENLQAFAEEGVTKSREAFAKMNTVAQDSAKATEEVLLAAQAGAKAIGEKMVHNTTVNAQAVFDAANRSLAPRRSLKLPACRLTSSSSSSPLPAHKRKNSSSCLRKLLARRLRP